MSSSVDRSHVGLGWRRRRAVCDRRLSDVGLAVLASMREGGSAMRRGDLIAIPLCQSILTGPCRGTRLGGRDLLQ